MHDITEFFQEVLLAHGSKDIANDAFKKMLADDPALRAEYAEWCHATGNSEKNGFLEFCDEYIENQHSIYDSLSDYNDE